VFLKSVSLPNQKGKTLQEEFEKARLLSAFMKHD
jgi:hypothetical protein